MTPHFIDHSGENPDTPAIWPATIVQRAMIEQEIERLADLPLPANGRRQSAIVHPFAVEPGLGFAPGIDVTLHVLKPGEATAPIRRNANQLEMCIAGEGVAEVNGQAIRLAKWDVGNIPSMQRYRHVNTGHDLFVRMVFSNTPLLQKLGVHYFEEDPPVATLRTESDWKLPTSGIDLDLGTGGARLRSYEYLVDIDVVESRALLWPWQDVRNSLAFAPRTNNRGIMLLYNPATERRNGTTHSFFAAISGGTVSTPLPPVRRGHRHSSSSINYYFMGRGKSIVDGRVFEWEAGDLMLAAPGWSEHCHYVGASDGAPFDRATLTVQDHPMHIALESLIWQEEMDQPITALGSEPGVKNYVGPRSKVVAS